MRSSSLAQPGSTNKCPKVRSLFLSLPPPWCPSLSLFRLGSLSLLVLLACSLALSLSLYIRLSPAANPSAQRALQPKTKADRDCMLQSMSRITSQMNNFLFGFVCWAKANGPPRLDQAAISSTSKGSNPEKLCCQSLSLGLR